MYYSPFENGLRFAGLCVVVVVLIFLVGCGEDPNQAHYTHLVSEYANAHRAEARAQTDIERNYWARRKAYLNKELAKYE